jgi:hypothetical protein
VGEVKLAELPVSLKATSMQSNMPLNGASPAASSAASSVGGSRYRMEISAANSAGLWQVRDMQSGLRRWLRYLGEGEAGAAAAQAAHTAVAAKPYVLGLVRTDLEQGQQALVLRWLGETPLAVENLNGNAAHYALQLLDAVHDLTSLAQPIALPELHSAQLLVVPNAQRLRLGDLSAAQVGAGVEALKATRAAARQVLASLVPPENSIAGRYADLASAWENDAAVYPDLRLALAQLQYGQLLAQE